MPVTGVNRAVNPGDFRPGVFTTLVSSSGEARFRLPLLDLHLRRLISNGRAAGLLETAGGIKAEDLAGPVFEFFSRAAAAEESGSTLPQLICRLILFADDETKLLLSAAPYLAKWPPGAPIDLITVLGLRPNPEIKSTGFDLCTAASAQAKAAGGSEALLVDAEGHVREGAWSNIFWVDRRNRILTPARSVLPGIVRQVLLECGAAETTDQEKTVDQLLAEACGVFITQSTTGITPVGSIDGKSAGTTGVPAMKKAVLAYQSAAAGRAAA